MLSAFQIEALRLMSEQLLDPITNFLIEDIAKRISEAGQLTATASYQVWRAQNLGISQRKLKKELQKRLKVSQEEVERLLTQSAETGYNFDISRFPTTHAIPLAANSSLQQILEATVKLAQEDLTNITQTMGFVGSDGVCRELTQAYQQACDFAFQKVSTGAQDYMSAVREATKNLVDKGIRTIDYESGVHTSVEAAVRRNIMGGLGLMQEQISEKNHDLLGCDGWEISAHAASAPDHEPFQGKQYSDEEYTQLNNSLVRRIGTLNCGHAALPIILGVSSPQFTDDELEQFRKDNEAGVEFEGKHYTMYEATQRQRKLERSIRKQKRRILADESLGDKDKLQNDQIRLVRLQSEYNRFSKGTGLRTQHARMEMSGFGPKQAKVAEKTAKKSEIIGQKTKQRAHAYTDGSNKIDWPPKSESISLDQFKTIRAYAESKNIQLQGFKNSDVDTGLAKEVMQDAERIFSKYPELRGGGKKPFTILFDRNMRSVDFAEVKEGVPHILHLNSDAYRSKKCLDQEYKKLADERWFVGGTTYRSIVYHEMGHMASDVYKIDGLEVMKEVLGVKSTAETLLWCKNNLSEYSFKSDGSEIISEVFSAFYSLDNPGQEIVDFMARCDKMIIEWRGSL